MMTGNEIIEKIATMAQRPRDPWAEYAAKRRRGDVHPPSVTTRTDADRERQARNP